MKITKAGGENEVFSAAKLKRSIQGSGATRQVIDQVIKEVQSQIKPGDSTASIYQLAFKLLRQNSKTYAAKYSLKKAVMSLGPDGFPFEQYFAALLDHYGYDVYTNQIFRGKCITHEIDVVAEKPAENIHAIIEAKFHTRPGRKTGSKDALYTHARFLDIKSAWVAKRKKGAKPSGGELQSWLVTNTEVTSEARKYASCVGMHIVSWNFPKNKSLKDLIHHESLYPLTILLTLNHNQKRQLLQKGIVMCKDLLNNKSAYRMLHLSRSKENTLKDEIAALCGIKEPAH